jgi:hypothetical protein
MDRRNFIYTGIFGTAACSCGFSSEKTISPEKTSSKYPPYPIYPTHPAPGHCHDYLSWQCPTKLSDIWKWAVYFAETNPKVGVLVSLREEIFKKSFLPEISRDFAIYGNAFRTSPYHSGILVDPKNIIFMDGALKARIKGKEYLVEESSARQLIDADKYFVYDGINLMSPAWHGYFKYLLWEEKVNEWKCECDKLGLPRKDVPKNECPENPLDKEIKELTKLYNGSW